MSQLSKSANPNDRMGVFKRLDDVPDRYRLYQHAAAYDGEDTYADFLDEKLFADTPDGTRKFNQSVRRAGERWKAHMDEQGRHHALATPEDVEAWCEHLLDTLTLNTACAQYWVRIKGFYSWLQAHPQHPHTYQPVLMAVAKYPNSKAIWNYKLTKGNGKSDGWKADQ